MRMKSVILLLTLSAVCLIPIIQVEAASNPNLFVSAENSQFKNRFSGSMVVEVIVRDPNLQDTDQGKGEPDVTINGKSLRMVQSSNGNWYAYFANVDKAKIADSTVSPTTQGQGLDFGVFCSGDTPASVFGISLSETDGFAVPGSDGLSNFSNGLESFNQCAGTPTAADLNNVVRNAPSINTNTNLPGQIGLNQNAWPLIQLFSFKNVKIQYNPAGTPQTVNLEYSDSGNITFNLDRDTYPQNSEIFLSVNDFQLNQDPTDEDSWTFNIDSPFATFYQAFDNSGSTSGTAPVNLAPHLSKLGFKDNGKLSMVLGNVIKLKTNTQQPTTLVTGTTFSQIVTLVENGPNSGIFDNGDDNDKSTIAISGDAPRGQAGQIKYNEKNISVLTGSSTSSISISKPVLTVGDGSTLKPGTKFPVVLVDSDQNLNSGSRDRLDVFRNNAIIPSMKIGNPVTLEKSSDIKLYNTSTDSLTGPSRQLLSLTPDKNSARLFIDTTPVSTAIEFEKISFNLGITASSLSSSLINTNIPNKQGTNWVNIDLRSFEKDLNVNDFSDTAVTLYFGDLSDSSPLTIINSGDLSNPRGLIQLDKSVVQKISDKSGSVFVVINFDSSNNSFSVGKIENEIVAQPIILDFFSFGFDNLTDINNSIYRFELEETSDNSSKFIGSLEYSVTNQLNILDPNFIKTMRTIDDDIKFIVTNRLIGEKGISISYSDLDKVGVITTTSTKSDILTNSGVVSTGSTTYRFGQPVTITLKDPDLNLKSDNVDIYPVNNDPNSSNVDTVGNDGTILLEILIKDIRYKRCTVNGVHYGGLASTGFTLVETGPSTGVFEGSFKMPSQICNKSGTQLVSTAGGSLDVKYHDSRDSTGNQNIFGLSRDSLPIQHSSSPQLSTNEITIPSFGTSEDIILSGSIANHKSGIPLSVILTHPDGSTQNFSATISNNGNYRTAFSINENSIPGIYKIQLSHNGINIGLVSFTAHASNTLEYVKANVKQQFVTSDSQFHGMLKQMINDKIILSSKENLTSKIPNWVKTITIWWSEDQISDDDFIKSIQYLVKEGII